MHYRNKLTASRYKVSKKKHIWVIENCNSLNLVQGWDSI